MSLWGRAGALIFQKLPRSPPTGTMELASELNMIRDWDLLGRDSLWSPLSCFIITTGVRSVKPSHVTCRYGRGLTSKALVPESRSSPWGSLQHQPERSASPQACSLMHLFPVMRIWGIRPCVSEKNLSPLNPRSHKDTLPEVHILQPTSRKDHVPETDPWASSSGSYGVRYRPTGGVFTHTLTHAPKVSMKMLSH